MKPSANCTQQRCNIMWFHICRRSVFLCFVWFLQFVPRFVQRSVTVLALMHELNSDLICMNFTVGKVERRMQG